MKLIDLNRQGGIGANSLLLMIGELNILVDCGLNPKTPGVDALPDLSLLRDIEIDLIIITHCHLDHIGGLPVVMRQHPKTPVLLTQSSRMLIEKMLHNSANVMQKQKEEDGVPGYPLFTHKEIEGLTKRFTGLPSDFTGIRDHDHVEAAGGIQWPFKEADAAKAEFPATERRLFADGKFFTADGRAKFHFDEPMPLPEPVSEEFPLLLNTGRGSSSQWHTGSRTNKSAVLRKLSPTQPWVEINPEDATKLGVGAGEIVTVRSRRGETNAVAVVTPIVQPGQAFMPMHFAEVNVLTFPAYDPHSRQPAYKACAITVVPLSPLR